ncbi:hypothetical protein FRC11_009338 [Ceratobasidium sp. 423]|nr:hypothetical protein FRC11_009338 [Ceratobasidium sp. 423]
MDLVAKFRTSTAGRECRWMIQLRETIQHSLHSSSSEGYLLSSGGYIFSSGGYYFHMSDFNSRLLLQLVKPNDVLKFVELHIDPDIALWIFCHSKGLGYDIFHSMSQVSYGTPIELTHPESMHPERLTIDNQTNPPTTHSKTISDIQTLDLVRNFTSVQGVGATVPGEAILAHWSTSQSSKDAESRKPGGVVMNVPDLPKTREDIMAFVQDFVRSLNKGVRKVTCSLCRGKKHNKLWDVKPTNLVFSCDKCGRKFTTKHQLARHSTKHRPNLA